MRGGVGIRMGMRSRMKRNEVVLPDGPTARGAGVDAFLTGLAGSFFLLLPLVGWKWLVIAAEAVDEAAVAFAGAFGGGGCGPGDGAEEFALFGSFEASFFAGFGFAVERLGYGGGGSLLA